MIRIGDDGSGELAPESTYNVAGTAWEVLHGLGSSLKPDKGLIKSRRIQRGVPRRGYTVGHVAGDIQTELDRSQAIVGTLLGLFGRISAGTLTIDGTAANDVASASARINHGGWRQLFTGLVGEKLRIVLKPEETVELTATLLGSGYTESNAAAATLPSDTGIVFPTDLGVTLVGGAAVIVKEATVEVTYSTGGGAGRKGLGQTGILQPIQVLESITGSLTCELSGDTGNDTEAILASWAAGTPLGDISLDGGLLVPSGCYMTGEGPTWAAGEEEFAVAFDASSVTMGGLTA